MAELTIQVSDELAHRLEPLRNRLPELLSQILDSANPSVAPLAIATANLEEIPLVYIEVLDFLVTRPTSQEIVAFKVSSEVQDRLRLLLDKNREGTLTASESAELDVYEQLDHLMVLMKARAIAAGRSDGTPSLNQ